MRKLLLIAVATLGVHTSASRAADEKPGRYTMAPADGAIYLRTDQALYKIGK